MEGLVDISALRFPRGKCQIKVVMVSPENFFVEFLVVVSHFSGTAVSECRKVCVYSLKKCSLYSSVVSSSSCRSMVLRQKENHVAGLARLAVVSWWISPQFCSIVVSTHLTSDVAGLAKLVVEFWVVAWHSG